MTQTVGLFVTFWAAPGRLDDLLDGLRSVAATVDGEEGTFAYAVHRVTGDRDGAAVYEMYRDADAQQRHGRSAAVTRLKERLPELLGAPPELRHLAPLSSANGFTF